MFFLTVLLSECLCFEGRYYVIYFKDKGDNILNISKDNLLSKNSIEKRIKQNIPIDYLDYPIYTKYVDKVVENNVKVILYSKWLNCIVINVKDFVFDVEKTLQNYDFISKIIPVNYVSKTTTSNNKNKYFNNELLKNNREFELQNNFVNGLELHNKGYLGKDVTIAVLDDGFYNVNVYSAFEHLYNENRVIATKNFINNSNIYKTGFHGCMVLSTLAAYIPESLIGSAPKANYMFFKTEDDYFESILEEYAWVAAAEYADSLGVDIISSTSVYTIFDNEYDSHSYSDLDGVTCPITIGAEIAASKGILVFNSAGNYGNSDWNYIGAPADGKNVIAIGGVNKDSTLWNSSSIGPTFDERIKPDLCALASNVVVLDPMGNGTNTTYMSGTSFAEPVVAGFSACLLEAFKNVEIAKIRDAIYLSSDRYNYPDNKFGYGIPNFLEAFNILSQISDYSEDDINEIIVYPNPINNNEFYIKSYNEVKNIQIFDANGRVVHYTINKTSLLEYQIKLAGNYNNNILLLNVFTDVNKITTKLFSQK